MTLPSNVAGGGSTTYNADNERTAFASTTLSYDANGNLLGDGTNSYAWDARNHLTGISGGTTASFVYDGFGRRMKKTVSGTTTQFLYDRLNPVQELNGSGGVVANLLTGLRIDEFFTRTDTATSTLLPDALGSTLSSTQLHQASLGEAERASLRAAFRIKTRLLARPSALLAPDWLIPAGASRPTTPTRHSVRRGSTTQRTPRSWARNYRVLRERSGVISTGSPSPHPYLRLAIAATSFHSLRSA